MAYAPDAVACQQGENNALVQALFGFVELKGFEPLTS